MSSTSYFKNASEVRIENLNLVDASHLVRGLDEALRHLYDNIAIEAVHNSAERYGAPRCHEDTRKAVQGDIHSWITDGDDDDEPKRVLWLTGPAGAGKTAIMGSVADTCETRHLLAGSFFFSSFAGDEKRRSKRYLVPTLTYYLVSQLKVEHPLRCAILTAIQRDPAVFQKRLDCQFKSLLLQPFRDTNTLFDPSTITRVLIIDGLDEVEAAKSREHGRDPHDIRTENEEDQQEILSALLHATSDPTFPFRIVIASRPERVIQSFFSSEAACITREIFLDNKYDPNTDIALYLHANFAKIRRRYRLPVSWPSEETIGRLVFTASGQFIYAATIIRYLQSGKHPNPQTVLDSLLDSKIQGCRINALAPLDALYIRILKSSPDPALAVRWIYVIDEYRESLWGHLSATLTNQLLQDYDGQASYLLESLASLVWTPPIKDERSPYRLHHKSFADFLRDDGRCGEELGEAFQDGGRFYVERCTDVFLNKSPTTHLPEPQLIPFLRDFARLSGLSSRGAPEKLVRCDVVWWVQFVRDDSRFGEVELPKSDWFGAIHLDCPRGSPGKCLPHCTHWRSNILRVYKGLGWDVPNVVAFLREGLEWEAEDDEVGFHIDFLGGFCQKPRRGQLDSSDTEPRAMVTRYTADPDYEATLDLVRAMFPHLPADWETRFQEERRINPKAVYTGLAGVIEKIRQELGIEAPDVLPRW